MRQQRGRAKGAGVSGGGGGGEQHILAISQGKVQLTQSVLCSSIGQRDAILAQLVRGAMQRQRCHFQRGSICQLALCAARHQDISRQGPLSSSSRCFAGLAGQPGQASHQQRGPLLKVTEWPSLWRACIGAFQRVKQALQVIL